MRIIHLSTWDTGGAAIAAGRLSIALNKLGHESQVLHMPTRFYAYLDALIGKFHYHSNPIFHSYNYFGVNLAKIVSQYRPDILHIHWIGAGFVRPESLFGLNVPIVWTLHDLWPLLGAEHLPSTIPSKSWPDFNQLLISRKALVYQNQQINFIAPSNYVVQLAKKQKLLGKNSLIHIPNGLDSNIFKPNKNVANNRILFLANNPHLDLNKGYSDFQKAISILPASIISKFPVNVITGGVKNDQDLAKMYQQAAVTVVPSHLETLSYVAMESLACGNPVVAYNVGGIPDLVKHNVNGYLAKPYDINDLSVGIAKLLNSPKLAKNWGDAGRSHVVNNFEIGQVAKEHLNFYTSVLQKFP